MPFRYYGAKRRLAPRYPAPRYPTIIEPFAGSAAYAVHWAGPASAVTLVERDARVVALWRRLQAATPADIAAIECPPVGERCDEPLVNLVAASENTLRSRRFHDAAVTSRMVEKWPTSRRNLVTALPLIRSWTIIEGDYTDAPDVEATWFIDPPYARYTDAARGANYRHGADDIDYAALADWCRARRGQVIVCEQEGATWLPFVPFARHRTTSSARRVSVEMVWTNEPIGML